MNAISTALLRATEIASRLPHDPYLQQVKHSLAQVPIDTYPLPTLTTLSGNPHFYIGRLRTLLTELVQGYPPKTTGSTHLLNALRWITLYQRRN